MRGHQLALRYFDGCPNWRVAEQRRRQALDELGASDVPIGLERVETPERARALAFRGSPTVLIDGEDPFLDENAPVGLTCRLYRSPEGVDGAPSLLQLRAVLAA